MNIKDNVIARLLLIVRVSLKIILFVAAYSLGAKFNALFLLLFVIIFTEAYRFLIHALIKLKKVDIKQGGAFIGAFDGAAIIFLLFLTNSLQNDLYLFIILSIGMNAIEYGLLSAVTQGLVGGFAYTIFILKLLGVESIASIYTTYFLRIIFITCFGWIIGILRIELDRKTISLEEVLENNIHEEKLNVLKDTVLNGSAESLKTPMAAIKGYIDILIHGRQGELSENVQKSLKNITKNVEKVESLIDDLLHLVDLNNDVIKISKQKFTINNLIKQIKTNAQADAKIYKISMEIRNTISDSSCAFADKHRIHIAMKSLLHYVFANVNKSIRITCKEDAKNIFIDLKCLECNEEAIDLLKLPQIIAQQGQFPKNSLLQIYTSYLIIEAHAGTLELSSLKQNAVTIHIKLPIK